MPELKKYIVTTACTAITVYYIDATSKEEAEQKYQNGDWVNEEIVDYQNESIVSTEEYQIN